MLEIITYLFALGFRLMIKQECGQARVTVVDTKTNLSHSQLLPVDHHLDDSLSKCIEFCIDKLNDELGKLKKVSSGN